MQNVEEKENKQSKKQLVQTIIGAVLCVILGFVLVCNLTIIIKGSIHPEEPPSIFSVTPLVVVSESMEGTQDGRIDKGDLIFVKDIEYDELKIGDVITFRANNGDLVTHRIIRVDDEGNFVTKGDNPLNDEDKPSLTEDRFIGIVTGRIPKIGDFALFLQTTWGMALFVGVPLIAFILYDVIRRQLYAKKDGDKTAELEAEVARLRALAGEAPTPTSAPVVPVTTEATSSTVVPESVSETENTEAPAEESADTDTATGE